jgi:RNA polymerase sigma-70 factor (ECF subfamily)
LVDVESTRERRDRYGWPVPPEVSVDSLRAHDEAAFAALVAEHGPSMLRIARMFVRDRAVAEEVVQEAWLGVLRGIDRFEGRSSLKTWILRILTNTAKRRAEREGRTIPFSAIGDEAAVDPDRFLHEGPWTGHWSAPPSPWDEPEGRLLASELNAVVEHALETLPPAQATVLAMRDLVGFESDEVCHVLDLSETNQRVLLHRARSKVRRALEDYHRS